MPNVKRDLLEINEFQWRVLKPFYATAFCAAILFAAMVYGVFFFPDLSTTKTMILTTCEAPISFPVVAFCLLSFIFSLGAFLVSHRLERVSDEKVLDQKKSETFFLSSLVAGCALLFSVSLLVLILTQKFLLPYLKLNPIIFSNTILLQQIVIAVGGLGVITIMIGLFFWAYTISNKVLGPYERIVRDLDKMIGNQTPTKLVVRPSDEMFKELIARINILIKNQKEKSDES